MAKFTIPVENLPPPNSEGNHVFRFRIVSEDRNLFSEYSNLITVQSKGQIYPLQVSASASIQSNNIVVAWDTPSIYNYSPSATLYKNGINYSGYSASVLHSHGSEWRSHDTDIFVNWFIGSYQGYTYYGRTRENSIIIPKISGATRVRILGEVASYVSISSSATYNPSSKSINSLFKIFETSELLL